VPTNNSQSLTSPSLTSNLQQVVVQVVIIADDNDIRDKLADHGFHVQTVAEVAPIEVQPARVLSHLYTYLGRNKKLGLTGRKSRDVGILSTSKLYSLKDRIFAFTPQVNFWLIILTSTKGLRLCSASVVIARQIIKLPRVRSRFVRDKFFRGRKEMLKLMMLIKLANLSSKS
jgi:hypothetical protein